MEHTTWDVYTFVFPRRCYDLPHRNHSVMSTSSHHMPARCMEQDVMRSHEMGHREHRDAHASPVVVGEAA